jgi:hypothetical protein
MDDGWDDEWNTWEQVPMALRRTKTSTKTLSRRLSVVDVVVVVVAAVVILDSER